MPEQTGILLRPLTEEGRTVAISGVGVAAPSMLLPVASINESWGRKGGRGQLAVCRSDEDTLTLAVTAAMRALHAGELSPERVGGLWWGTTRSPFAEGPAWSYVAAMLRLDSDCDGSILSGSPHSGIEALLAAVDAMKSGRVDNALVVTSDALIPALGSTHETACGSGAAAWLLSREGPAQLISTASSWEPVLDRYRGSTEVETRDAYDGRLFRDEIFLPIVSRTALALGAPTDTRWSTADPDGRLGSLAAKELSDDPPVSLGTRRQLGDTAAAAAMLGASAALDEPGPLAIIGYGGGRATSILIEVDQPVAGAGKVEECLDKGQPATYTQVLRARGQLKPSGESVEMAVPPGSAMFVRDEREVLGLLGARCVECNTVNLPPSVHPSCPGCGGTKFDIQRLPTTGVVQTYVINQTMPAPFEAPLPLVVVDLSDGSRVQLQGADDGSDLAVGSEVELVPRRYTIERGVPVYGWKVRTLGDSR